MQEINLLENRVKDTTQVWDKRNQLFITLVVLILILEAGLSIVFYLLAKNTDNRIQTVSAEHSAIQAQINESQVELTGAKSFQAQLKNVRSLVTNHIYWSGFFDEIADFTLTEGVYVNLKADTFGVVHLEGQANSYSDLGKLILGLNRSENFDDVKLLAVNPSDNETAGFKFSIDLIANKKLFLEDK
jgi:Tfp pilus assembly protein PilN